MKKLIFVVLTITIWACNPRKNPEQTSQKMADARDRHSYEQVEESDQDQMMTINPHKGTSHAEDMVAMLNVSDKFHEQLNAFFIISMDLKDAFVESDPGKVEAAASRVIDQLGKIDSKLLEPQAHEIWMGNLMGIAHMLNRIKQSDSIEEQREGFAMFNRALYRSFKFLGHKGDPIYYQYCPMAFDNQGAYWLSSAEEIRNPYFGDKMLTCGSTKEVIN